VSLIVFGCETRTTPVQYARLAQWAYDWQWVAGLRYNTWQGKGLVSPPAHLNQLSLNEYWRGYFPEGNVAIAVNCWERKNRAVSQLPLMPSWCYI